jgi:hypothetical protein
MIWLTRDSIRNISVQKFLGHPIPVSESSTGEAPSPSEVAEVGTM